MNSRAWLALLTSFAIVAEAADIATYPSSKSSQFTHWSDKELRGYESVLHETITGPRKNSSIKLADFGTSAVQIGHREANGIAEAHAHNDDYFVVQSGAATLVVGGEIEGAKLIESGEIRGDAIKGGEQRKLNAGDVVHIPANVAHQLLIPGNRSFTYLVIKVVTP